jgi:predicted enzyme related to lactoylglutathione lyase
MANQIVWCDIPDRAVGFYSAVLGRQVTKQEFPGITMGFCRITTARLAGAWSKVRQKSRPMEVS